ncbi:hypothetical protein CspHIS471_0310810 [Cutaneotrichosporon sp. HIS471]|nr:hypothetical protein CspHIS471_0310810 [Cutaneotrichosporon sp. HIS471]
MDPPTHLRIRVSPSNELSVLTPSGAIPFTSYVATTSLTAVRILDLDLEPTAGSGCACGRTTLPASLEPFNDLGLDMVRRWTPHSCAAPKARRVVNLDCTGLSGGGEGDEFHLAGQEDGVRGVGVYNGLWEYDEFPRFVVEGSLPAQVVVRVMAPGDEEELEEGEEGEEGGEEEAGDGEGEEEEAGDGEGEEDEGVWEDEDDDADADEDADSELHPDSQEVKIRALMAQTKYLPLAAFIAQAKDTRFTLVDVESWDEDEDGVEDKIRAEIGKALAGREVDDVVRFVSLEAYRTEVGRDAFRLESQNSPPW